MDQGCIFCNSKNFLKTHLIYSGINLYAIFDSYPVSPGHALVVPKRHIPSMFDLTTNEWRELFNILIIVKKLIEQKDLKGLYIELIKNSKDKKANFFYNNMLKKLNKNSRIEGYNIGINEGEVAGQTIDHLHIHIIPRYLNDVPNPIGGVRNVIPELGDYKKEIFPSK
ncbi:HIT family protein [Desulfothermus okinawensis JCM 13304]